MPRFERDAPVLPTLLSQGSPNIHDLLNGVQISVFMAWTWRVHLARLPDHQKHFLLLICWIIAKVPNLGVPPVAPPPPSPKRTVPRASSNSVGLPCGAMAYQPSNPTAQAVPMMPPRTQSTVSAGVSPMSATRQRWTKLGV